MVMTFQYSGRLVALNYGEKGFFAWRDDTELRIPVRPVGLPVILESIRMRTPFSKVLHYFEQAARGSPEANAFTHKIVPGNVGDRRYNIAAQYYVVSQRNWQRIQRQPIIDHAFGAFF